MKLELKEKEFEPKRPDFRGKLDVAGWVNVDKNGEQYISIKIANTCNLFANKPKEKE